MILNMKNNKRVCVECFYAWTGNIIKMEFEKDKLTGIKNRMRNSTVFEKKKIVYCCIKKNIEIFYFYDFELCDYIYDEETCKRYLS